ncbi:uncharacterized protein LOC141649095 [Silene latifolia]|uniref:uncharacterized protein LOC141649095 n=1 Tax=Silene latifolia TaxID=37657 RepID=UPI003D76ADEA
MNTSLFDLNHLPSDEEDMEDIVHRDSSIGVIPIMVHSYEYSTNNLILDMGDNEEARYRYWDVNVESIEDDVRDDDQEYQGEGDEDIEEYGNEDAEVHEHSNVSNLSNKKLFLTNAQRMRVYNALLERSDRGKLRRNTTTEVSNLLSVPLRTVQRIWKLGKSTGGDVKHKKKKNCGRRKVQVDLSRIMDIELNKRTTLRSLAEALGIGHTVLFRHFKEGLIRRHSNTIKPYLKDEHKWVRLRFCLYMLDQSTIPCEPKFIGMYYIVHIDEKWFYITKKTEKYYLLPIESDPLRTCQSKNFIGKVMFLVAMARPRFDSEGKEIFSGKIGVFPLVNREPAIRRSRNREAGTLVTKPIPSITRDVIRRFLIEKVIPSIQSSWPIEDSGKTIFIQQDNARTHISPNDQEFHRAATQNGFDIRLTCQPANSPDLNILDLGFFSAIQSLQQKKRQRRLMSLFLQWKSHLRSIQQRRLNGLG